MTEYEYEYYSAFQNWPNTNTNIIRLSKIDRIRIRILFGLQSCMHTIRGYISIHTVEKIFRIANNVILHFWSKKFEVAFGNAQWETKDKCNHCKYAKYQTGNLRTQMKMHNGKKLNQCDYVSSDPITLRKHLKRHSGDKSNKCNQCNVSTWPANLRIHLKSHSEEKSIPVEPIFTMKGCPDHFCIVYSF